METILRILASILIGIAITAPAAAETKLKLAHVGPTTHPLHQAAITFASVAADLSGGELNVRVFHSSQLGTAKEAREGLQLGTVDVSLDSIDSLSAYHPAAGVESMPYLFRDEEHYMQLWNGPIGEEIKDLIAEEANFRMMGHLYRGTSELTSSKKVTSIEDLAGLKIRVYPVRERLETWRVFGASPTPMAWSELFTALQQGVVEAQENPVAAIHAAKLFEVQKYLIRTSHIANGFTFLMNAERYDAMPEEQQLALRGAALAAAAEFRATIRANWMRLIEALEDEGMEIIEIDQSPFRAKAAEVVALFPEVQPWYEKMTAE